jgi:hypothetical protein
MSLPTTRLGTASANRRWKSSEVGFVAFGVSLTPVILSSTRVTATSMLEGWPPYQPVAV